MRLCRNTVSALRDSRKTVSGGKFFDLLKVNNTSEFDYNLSGRANQAVMINPKVPAIKSGHRAGGYCLTLRTGKSGKDG
jgi:hypothetical protein